MTGGTSPPVGAGGFTGTRVELASTDFVFVTDRPPLRCSPTGFGARYAAFIDALARVGTVTLVVSPRREILNDAGLDHDGVQSRLAERFGSEVEQILVREPPQRRAAARKLRHHMTSWLRRRSPWSVVDELSSLCDQPGCLILAHASLAHLGYRRAGRTTVFLLEEGSFERVRRPGGHTRARATIRRWYVKAVTRRIYRAVAKAGGLVVAISDREADYFSRWIPRERVVTVPNGIDLEEFADSAPSLARRQSSGFTVGVIGHLGAPRNAIPTVDLIRAWRSSPALQDDAAIEWRLIGAAPASEIRALAEPGVVVTGYVSDFAVELQGLDVAVIPASDAQGAKSTLLAAWASGLPTVISSASASVMPVAHGENGLVFGSTAEAIEALRALRQNAALRHRIGEAGRRTAQDFAANRLAERFVSNAQTFPRQG